MNLPNIVNLPCQPGADPRCADPVFAAANPAICNAGSGDPRCSDPAFALANPDICLNQKVLVLKPNILIACSLMSVQFQAFIDQNGTETQLTSGVTYTSSDPSVAVIGGTSGNATGIKSGTVTITAAYSGMTTTATLEILASSASGSGNTEGCCGVNSVATILVIDVSVSMSLQFGSGWNTKVDYAKAVAAQYAAQTNTPKDEIGMVFFDSAPTTQDALTTNTAQVVSDINDLQSDLQITGIGLALQAAALALSASAAPIKIIALISDGEDKSAVPADDAITISETFKNSGGIIMCLGVRAHDYGFDLLNGIASGGFFLNAYPANAAAQMATLMGLKGYLCAGNCTPAGDMFKAEGSLNYHSFINWDVSAGTVDLIGNGFFDLLPGNGLYVDLAGTTAPFAGSIFTKTNFTFLPNKTYRLSFMLAGNQRANLPGYAVQVKIGTGGSILNQTVSMPDWLQPFTRYAFNFTVPASSTGNISFTQLFGGAPNDYGNLLDAVSLDDVTDGTNLFADNFDTENMVYIPPACGPSQTIPGYFGYNCYGTGCLSAPPGPVTQDPNPLPDIEAGYVAPVVYTATDSETATCPNGSQQLNQVSIVPVMTGYTSPSGVVSTPTDIVGNEGWRAFGTGPSWKVAAAAGGTSNTGTLFYSFPVAETILAVGITPGPAMNGRNVVVQINAGATTGSVTNQTGQFQFVAQTGVRVLIPLTNPGLYLVYELVVIVLPLSQTPVNSIVEVALWEMFTAAPNNNGITKTATATSTISQQDAQNKARAAALAAAQKALAYAGCAVSYTATESFTATCGPGLYGNPNSVTASASYTSYIFHADAVSQALALATAAANAQLLCTASNNTAAIVINNDTLNPVLTPATPYWSTEVISGLAGNVTKVTVTLIGLKEVFADSLLIGLLSPQGTFVALMFFTTTGASAPTPVTLTFDDAAGGTLPNSALSTGTFKPTTHAGATMPAPAPNGTLALTLATFIGENPNGAWSLWVGSGVIAGGDQTGVIAGGWLLSITTGATAPVLSAGGGGVLNWTWGLTNPGQWTSYISPDGVNNWTIFDASAGDIRSDNGFPPTEYAKIVGQDGFGNNTTGESNIVQIT